MIRRPIMTWLGALVVPACLATAAPAAAAPPFELLCDFSTLAPFPVGALVATQDGSLLGGGLGAYVRLPPLTAGTGPCPGTVISRLDPLETPQSELVIGRAGQLYGTTGRIYRFDPPPRGQTLFVRTLVHEFTVDHDGRAPIGAPVEDAEGRLYGATSAGGITAIEEGGSPAGWGTIYRLSPPVPPQTAWTLEVLYRFRGPDGGHGLPDGALPLGKLLARTVGGVFTLFGTAAQGGTHGYGTVFSVTPPASGVGPWTETTLHDFAGGPDGAVPLAGLIADRSLHLYGTASRAGKVPITDGLHGGVVFRMTPPVATGGPWAFDTLYAFGGGKDGALPAGALIQDSNAVLYGTTQGNCVYENQPCAHDGTVFKLTPRDLGGRLLPWNQIVLHEFAGADGNVPQTALTPRREPDGTIALYGTTFRGGPAGMNGGVAFRVHPARPFAP